MCDIQPRQVDIALVVACANNNINEVRRLVEEMDADICFQDPKSGMSVLMAAAGSGYGDIVEYLLSEGAPWNAVDRNYLCAGDYAAKNGYQNCIDILMNHAVMSEFILAMSRNCDGENTNEDIGESDLYDSLKLSTSLTKKPLDDGKTLNASYLASRLEYTADGNCLIDTNTKLAVMMNWEEPLMEKHAAWICHADQRCMNINNSDNVELHVLNVGFGMGIIDKIIQKYQPTTHIIIEAHPEVLNKMETDEWSSKPGVRIIPNRWQDAVLMLCKEIEEGKISHFDGIFFDTYAEDESDFRKFHTWLPKLLHSRVNKNMEISKRNILGPGRYSYYNGLCPDNVFFHGVACETMRLHLKRLGLSCEFEPITVNASDPELWKDISQRYWYFDTYFLPKCEYDGYSESNSRV